MYVPAAPSNYPVPNIYALNHRRDKNRKKKETSPTSSQKKKKKERASSMHSGIHHYTAQHSTTHRTEQRKKEVNAKPRFGISTLPSENNESVVGIFLQETFETEEKHRVFNHDHDSHVYHNGFST
jgi:hypothetical protein